MLKFICGAALALSLCGGGALAQTPAAPKFDTQEGDFVLHNFKFQSGETLPELRLHYTTLGTPTRDARGHVNNAVLILHGTGGSGHQFLSPQFANVLYAPGELLDVKTHYIILPDDIGHGKSSKPSDGLHAKFPRYGYHDMVAAEHALVHDGLHVDHLRLVMGTSMGCMHSFMWGEEYAGEMDALMPLACLPVQIAGRNVMWRHMIVDAIQKDPAWQGGEYKTQPAMGLRVGVDMLVIAGSAPLPMQLAHPARDGAIQWLDNFTTRELASLDANDFMYQVDSSRDYDPSADLEKIKAPLMWVNSGDDFINPPELGIAQKIVTRIPHGTFVLIPGSANTHGHGTHTWAAIWHDQMAELLKESEPHN